MNLTRIYTRAKINLSLDVLQKRDDGYHEVKMIMQTLSLADIVDVIITDTNTIELTTNLPYVPTNNKNIAYKACELFFSYTKIPFTGVKINIYKKIPVSAGLAGGSTNASGVLIALNKLYKTNLSMSELMEISLPLGADVPYCIHGGTMLAEGIGEKLSPLPPAIPCKVILCKPPFSVPTAGVYKEIIADKIEHRPDTEGIIDCIKNEDLAGMSKRMYNVLEDVTAKRHKEINIIKNSLLDFKPNGVLMSGSGPTVFGLFENEKNALKAFHKLRKNYRDTYLTDISNDINNI
ncbi:MAG: 4-(cytidine 5'-diphospho)-2-C-methyl-D-erythritol kinase [Clostridia bacterium]